MNMRLSVDVDFIVYSFIQNLQNREKLGRFAEVVIDFNDPVSVSFKTENKEEEAKIDSTELVGWVTRYKEHRLYHDLPMKEKYEGHFEL